MKIVMATLLLSSLLFFNNCSSSKWSSSAENSAQNNSNNMPNENSTSTDSQRQPAQSGTCVTQSVSAASIQAGQSFVFEVSSTSSPNQTQIFCQHDPVWKNIQPDSNTGISLSRFSISNLSVGIYSCQLRLLNLQNQFVNCSGGLSFTVIQPTEIPAPAPSPVATPQPNPNSSSVIVGGKGLYRTDENLPDALSTFTALRPSQIYLSNHHVVAETGMAGLRFPSSGWNVMGATDTIRLAVLVPPGVSSVSWSTEFNSKSQLFGSCSEDGVTCHDQSYSPALWPISLGRPEFDPGFNPMTATPTSIPRIVFLTIKSTGKEGWLMSLTVTYVVQNPEMYERWRSMRKWAGGSGDCDGLGNRYFSGIACQNQNW